MVKGPKTDLSVVLAGIQGKLAQIEADVGYIKQLIDKTEGYTHHINKRLQKAENTLSFVKGGMWIFMGIWTVVLAFMTLMKT